MPPLDQQERLIQDRNILPHKITSRAFVNVWGKPPYHHSEFAHFFVMKDGTMIPRSRAPAGEAPVGWESLFDVGEGVFFAYPDHGRLLVFVDEELVYREELTAEQLHQLGKAWQHEDRFKTRLDKASTP